MKKLVVGVFSLFALCLACIWLWGGNYYRQGLEELSFLNSSNFPVYEVLKEFDQYQSVERDSVTMSIFQKMDKEIVADLRDMKCAKLELRCNQRNLKLINFFSFFDTSKFQKTVDDLWGMVRSYYEDNSHECPIDYENARLNYELNTYRKLGGQEKEAKFDELIMSMQAKEFYDFDLSSFGCISSIKEAPGKFASHLYLISIALHESGEAEKGLLVLLSHDPVRNLSNYKTFGSE